jgi:hypothetical protein
LRLDHLSQRLRDLQGDLARRTPKPPASSLVLEESTLQQVLHHGDHEQRIAFGMAVQQRNKLLRHHGRGLRFRQILRNFGIGERRHEDFPAQVARHQIALERMHR